MGLGRAHHRVIYFVGRHPDKPVSHLLDILSITKQSLSRVLNQLVAQGYILQIQPQTDKRQRLLRLTDKGMALEKQLTEIQRNIIANAYQKAGMEAVSGFKTVLLGLLDKQEDRARFGEM